VEQLPIATAGEDEQSLKKHIDAIGREMKRTNPDVHLLADKLKRTVAYRHRLCAEAEGSAGVLEQFPCLRMALFVSLV
jgi:hypothetical protein